MRDQPGIGDCLVENSKKYSPRRQPGFQTCAPLITLPVLSINVVDAVVVEIFAS